MKLGLGTAQFGLDYGISNREGQTSQAEAGNILAAAQQHRIGIIDTAALYGNSEEVLGRALPAGHPFKVVTKTIRINAGHISTSHALSLEKAFEQSLVKLRCESVYGLMIHNADDLLAVDGSLLYDKLSSLKAAGRVEKIGVSVYTARQIDQVLDRYDIDLVQLPLNVLDQRLLTSGHLAMLRGAGIEIHVRSAFLQGLLLMDPATLAPHFDPARQHLARYHGFLRANGITPLQAALGFVCGMPEVDAVICGVNNRGQLDEICSSCNPLAPELFAEFALTDTCIVDPSNWAVS